jgi:plasmid maintenance system killer protein
VAILKFRHKRLERFFKHGTTAGIKAKHAERLRLILGRLNVAVEVRDMALTGLQLSIAFNTTSEGWLRQKLEYDLPQVESKRRSLRVSRPAAA